MSLRIIHRPARAVPALTYPEPVRIETPPDMPDHEAGGSNPIQLVTMIGSAGAMTLMMLMRNSRFAAFGAIMMLVMLVGAITMFASQRGRSQRTQKGQRSRYLDYLERRRRELRDDEESFRVTAATTYPSPHGLASLIKDSQRLWERRRGNSDFMHARLGTGNSVIRAVEFTATENATQIPDEFLQAEAQSVCRRFERASDVPVIESLDSLGAITVIGTDSEELVRGLLLQLAALNSPEDLQIALAAPEHRSAEWEFVQWLPHASLGVNAGGALRVAQSADELRAIVHRELAARTSRAAEIARTSSSSRPVPWLHERLVIVVDNRDGGVFLESPDPRFSLAQLGVTVFYLVNDRLREPERVGARLTQQPEATWVFERYRAEEMLPTRVVVTADPCPITTADAIARDLAPLRLSEESLEHSESRASMAFTEMMGVANIKEVSFENIWERHTDSTFLRVPIGVDDGGAPVVLDLKESAQFGMGPHGLCIGATGSGKSELLRTLVLGLLTTHGPEDLSMVLVDYKGGATFAPFVNAPQVSGLITNLSDDVSLVDRVYTSLQGEILRRQELLKSAGNINDITRYRARRAEVLAEGGEMMPMPHLMVIIDEFGELLTERPDFIDVFLSIGRIGRSIGVHLLLSSQRIEGGRLRGLDTYLSYRLGLRTLSEAESRTVLETADAFSLPPLPGYGYLKVDTTTYTRFRAGYVSGELPDPAEDLPEDVPTPRIGTTTMFAVQMPSQEDPSSPKRKAPKKQSTTAPTVMSTILDQLQLRRRAVPPIWLPPLPDALSLDQIDGPPHPSPGGLRLRASGPLRVPVGLLDDPARQDQRPWEIDLTEAGGNHVIIGGPQSGKSTFLQTIAVSAALTHTPAELGIYGIDLLGSSLLPLRDLPHVGGVATRLDPEVVRRTVEELSVMLQEREILFERYGVDSLATFRRRRAEGDIPEVGSTDILVLVDGWALVREEYESLEDTLKTLVTRGPGYGIRFIITGSKSTDIRFTITAAFPTRFELRLSDVADSSFGRKAAERMPDDRPGRVMTEGELFGHVALPRIDGEADSDTASRGLRELVLAIASSTSGRARQVRLLPRVVAARDVVPHPTNHALVPVGLEESTVETHYFDLLDRDSNVIILGDGESGKTSILTYLVNQMMARHTPDELVLAVFDPRRSLRDVFPEEYVGGYASSVAIAGGLLKGMLPDLDSRIPRTVESQDSASAMEGKARVLMVMDDYDVLSSAGANLLADLRRHVALGPEIKFQIFLTRRVQGAGRSMYEAGFSALRDSGAVGIQLSGDRSEGTLLGNVRPSKMPPGRGIVVRAGRPPEVVQFVQPD